MYLERHELETSNLVCMLIIAHSKSMLTNDKLSLKGAWSLSRDLFNVLENKRQYLENCRPTR